MSVQLIKTWPLTIAPWKAEVQGVSFTTVHLTRLKVNSVLDREPKTIQIWQTYYNFGKTIPIFSCFRVPTCFRQYYHNMNEINLFLYVPKNILSAKPIYFLVRRLIYYL